jgi:predicted secreted protein
MALKSTQYIQDTATGLAVGVGGNEYLRLRATQPGTQTLLFEYRRPWEKQAAPASTAEVRVAVTA